MIRYPWSPDSGESFRDAVMHASLMASAVDDPSYQIVRGDCEWCPTDAPQHLIGCLMYVSVIQPSQHMIEYRVE